MAFQLQRKEGKNEECQPRKSLAEGEGAGGAAGGAGETGGGVCAGAAGVSGGV